MDEVADDGTANAFLHQVRHRDSGSSRIGPCGNDLPALGWWGRDNAVRQGSKHASHEHRMGGKVICANCKAPLVAGRAIEYRVDRENVCAVCFEMVHVVNQRRFFILAALEEKEYEKQIGRLRPGANYFDK